MRRSFLFCLALLAVAALPASSLAAPKSGNAKALKHGTLVQLKGPRGCLVDRSARTKSCGTARALKGPGPFMGSRAIAVSPDGKNVYVASSRSDAIAIFRRATRTGTLTQSQGSAGCIANESTGVCAKAVGLDGPNSIAISPDGRSVYATSRNSNAITIFQRSPKGGGLTQLPIGFGCISGLPVPVCASGRALVAPDVVVISPDGKNVYVGSFFGNAIAVFNRDPASGALAQAAGTTGCLAESDQRLRSGPGPRRPRGPGDQRRRHQPLRRDGALQRGRRPRARSVDRRSNPGDGRQRLYRQRCARRLCHRGAAERRQRGRRQPRGR